ncbi:MAG TPA: hypothetical protein VEY91_00975, partial [Candidatus Limnocylindria bacterium]|nr:hypothetical protein [Candidatus Limnocylindria bacterium]
MKTTRLLRVVTLVGVCAIAAGAVPAQAQTPALRTVLSTEPTDSLPPVLQRLEADRTRPAESAEAAMALGQLHFARAEYREAANAFARAAARLHPARKPEARYWAGVSWLALG